MLFPFKSACCALLVSMAFTSDSLPQTPGTSRSGRPAQSMQPYSGTVWTTLLQPLADGSTHTSTRRLVINQDAQGKWKKTYYRSTRGAQYDTTSPVDHTESGTVANGHLSLVPSLSNGEVLELDENLGSRSQDGLLLQGRRRTFASIDRKSSAKHVLETWYSPVLGAIVHSENHNFNGVVMTTDLRDLQLGPVGQTSTGVPSPAEEQVSSEPRLYRGLFSIVAHMERARLAETPDQAGNAVASEKSMRKQMKLSEKEWQTLLAVAVKSDASTEQATKQAREYARQGRTDMVKSPNPASVRTTLLQGLHQMQLDEEGRNQKAIGELESSVGSEGTARIHAFLHGQLAASVHVTRVGQHSQAAQ